MGWLQNCIGRLPNTFLVCRGWFLYRFQIDKRFRTGSLLAGVRTEVQSDILLAGVQPGLRLTRAPAGILLTEARTRLFLAGVRPPLTMAVTPPLGTYYCSLSLLETLYLFDWCNIFDYLSVIGCGTLHTHEARSCRGINLFKSIVFNLINLIQGYRTTQLDGTRRSFAEDNYCAIKWVLLDLRLKIYNSSKFISQPPLRCHKAIE